jgi:cytochrome c-type biogenesis protein CcmH/NrfG
MDLRVVETAVWLGVLGAVIVAAVYVVLYLRKGVFSEEDTSDEDETSFLTTAEVERLKKEGLVDPKQYEKLLGEAREAARRRAEKASKRGNKKAGLFG